MVNDEKEVIVDEKDRCLKEVIYKLKHQKLIPGKKH